MLGRILSHLRSNVVGYVAMFIALGGTSYAALSLPFTVLEAMASGCLCVVADTGGLREVVPADGTVGIRFPSRDSDALEAILQQVLTDDAARAQLVAEAREHVLRFDWTEVARQTHSVYAALAGRDLAPAARGG